MASTSLAPKRFRATSAPAAAVVQFDGLGVARQAVSDERDAIVVKAARIVPLQRCRRGYANRIPSGSSGDTNLPVARQIALLTSAS